MSVTVTKINSSKKTYQRFDYMVPYQFFNMHGELWMYDKEDCGDQYVHNFKTGATIPVEKLDRSHAGKEWELVDVEIKWSDG